MIRVDSEPPRFAPPWADTNSERAPRLVGKYDCDVAVVGGGYVGLWTSIELKRRAPDSDIIVLERDYCGCAASGRNSGFALSWWAKVETLRKLLGDEAALELCAESNDCVDQLETFCTENSVPFRRSGWICAATAPAQVGRWRSLLQSCGELGAEPFYELTREELRARVDSPRHEGGFIDPTACLLDPGQLIRALRRHAIQSGVRVFEGTPALAISGSDPLDITVPEGTVKADQAVLAINAWAAGWRPTKSLVVGIASDLIATVPDPELLARVNWTGYEGITDARQMLRVYRPTPDGRVTLGLGGGGVAYGGKVTKRFFSNPPAFPRARQQLEWLFPGSIGRLPITHSWSAVVDRSATGLPVIGRDEHNPAVIFAVGWSGNGVAPSIYGARMISSALAGTDDKWARSPLWNLPRGKFPPEPFRYLGAQLVRRAVARVEDLEDAGRRAGPLTRRTSSLAPGNFLPVGESRQNQ
jgi:glycine/D-amino acid oxidase-like deaminating enzyme